MFKDNKLTFACFDPTSVTVAPELADLYAVPTDIVAFWFAVQPAMAQVMATQPVSPVRWGRLWTSSRVAVHDAWLRQFEKYMAAADPATGVPRWQLYVDPRPHRDQNYALWFLEEFFEFIRPPGFNI